MFLKPRAAKRSELAFLCLRRGVSSTPSNSLYLFSFSLPTQRCFSVTWLWLRPESLFSAYAEVFLCDPLRFRQSTHFSLPTQRCFRTEALSPSSGILFSAYAEVFPASRHTFFNRGAFLCLRRGVSVLRLLLYRRGFLFSAYAEVFPEQIRGCRLWFAFLCLRRGVSEYFKDSPEGVAFSLPTQRCFQIVYPKCHDPFLFSAYAEVFLLEYFRRVGAQSFLCLRRGVSIAVPGNAAETDFSLPTQRCFLLIRLPALQPHLFSAYAEVFPATARFRTSYPPFLCLRRGVSGIDDKVSFERRTFLCLRRGVSDSIIGSNRSADFSLPTQRCFSLRARLLSRVRLFSAYAEVFPDAITTAQTTAAFLCLRRGVSPPLHRPGCPGTFSLPTQRCFLRPHGSQSERPLFSAYAEVFPGEEPFIRIDDHFSLPTQRCFPVF